MQACAAFVETALAARDDDIRWHFFLSPAVAQQLRSLGLAPNETARVFSVSPARSVTAREELARAVDSVGADAVFTLFGPSYVKFRQPHLCGVADGWVTHASDIAYRCLPSWRRRVLMRALCLYKSYWLRRADRWVVEAECARRGLALRWRISPDQIRVVPNNCGTQYVRYSEKSREAAYDGLVRVLTVSAYYPIKNLEIILPVAELMRRRSPGRFKFVLTLSQADPEAAAFLAKVRRRGLEGMIENVGPVSIAEGPALYESCQVCLLPSLLETFSANYPEAMVMRRPMVTSNLPFARDVCGLSAMYVDPHSAESVAAAISLVADSAEVRGQLLAAAHTVWKSLPSQVHRYRMYRDIVLGMLDPVPR